MQAKNCDGSPGKFRMDVTQCVTLLAVTGWRAAREHLRPHRRRLDRHAAGAPHQEQLEVDELGRTDWIVVDPHAADAVAQPPLQRADVLPFEAIERVAGWMRLRDRRARELLLPIVIVALRASEIELALAAIERRATRFQERPRALVDGDIDRHATRLPRHVGVEREQVLALEREWRCLLA